MFELRAADLAISDDMRLCIDVLRWGQFDLYRLVALRCDRRRVSGDGGDRQVGSGLARVAVMASRVRD